MAYRVKKQFRDLPFLRTVLEGGKVVALNQAHKRQVKGTPKTPPYEVNVPLATQAEMKQLFDGGNACLEKYEHEEPRNLVAEHEMKNPFDDEESQAAVAEITELDEEAKKTKKKK